MIYFGQNQPIKVQIFEIFECLGQNLLILNWQVNSFPNFASFFICVTHNSPVNFLQSLHNSSVLWDITSLYFFSWNFIYSQQKQPIKVQIWSYFTWAVKSLKFRTLVGSTLISLMTLKSDAKFQEKLTSGFKYGWGIWLLSPQPLNSPKISLQRAIFVQSIWGLNLKKYREVIFHDTEQWRKIWINPDLVASKMTWRIGWVNFH